MTNAHMASTHYYYNTWGLNERPATSESGAWHIWEELGLLSALGNATGCDGEASAAECAYIRGMAAVKEYHYEAAEKIDALADAAETKSLEQVAAEAAEAMSVGTLCFAAPCIIYEALKAAAADGLDNKELQGIHVIANKMGVSKDKVDKIYDLIVEEETLKKKRIALCLPDHPCLDDKYKV